MKKLVVYLICSILLVFSTGFTIHKFYLGIYQIDFVPAKKRLEITSRIFLDDLNKALEMKYKKKVFHLGTSQETKEEQELLKKYLNENFSIKVNGQLKEIIFLSKELDSDVLVVYSTVRYISKIDAIEVFNSILTDWNSGQQNLTHIQVFGVKKSFLFTASSKSEQLKFN